MTDALKEMGDNAEALSTWRAWPRLETKNRTLGDELRNLEADAHMATHRVEEARNFRDLIRDKDEAARMEQSGRMSVTVDDLHREIAAQEKELATNPNQANRSTAPGPALRRRWRAEEGPEPAEPEAPGAAGQLRDPQKLGDVAIGLADLQIASVTKQLAAAPNNAALEAKLAELKERKNKYALEEIEWRRPTPTDRPCMRKLAQLQFDMGEYNQAIGSFQGLTQDARFAIEAARMLGLCFMRKGQ